MRIRLLNGDGIERLFSSLSKLKHSRIPQFTAFFRRFVLVQRSIGKHTDGHADARAEADTKKAARKRTASPVGRPAKGRRKRRELSSGLR
jgi:hypothetical protein